MSKSFMLLVMSVIVVGMMGVLPVRLTAASGSVVAIGENDNGKADPLLQ